MAKSRVRKKVKQKRKIKQPTRKHLEKKERVTTNPKMNLFDLYERNRVKLLKVPSFHSLSEMLEKFSTCYMKGENFMDYTKRRRLTLKQFFALDFWMEKYQMYIGYTPISEKDQKLIEQIKKSVSFNLF